MKKCKVKEFWESILDLSLVLWISRASMTSILVGILVLTMAPQAQDLFANWIGEPLSQPILFLVLLFFVWAVTLHYSARFLLDRDARLQDWRARRTGAALTRLNWIERNVPRGLGLMAFVAVLLALTRAWSNLPDIENDALTRAAERLIFGLTLGTSFTGLLFYLYFANRLGPHFIAFNKRLDAMCRALTGFPRSLFRHRSPKAESGYPFGVLYLFAIFLFCVSVVGVGAAATAATFSRGLALPIIFGAWLPVLTLASYYGRRHRVPYIALAGLLLLGLSALFGDNHTVRRVTITGTAAHLDMGEAVRLWRHANDCELGDGKNCPRPIIVSAAGGASRAGFVTASALGDLIDQVSPDERDASLVRKRLFAISGVSGGSVGAIFAVAALKQAGPSGRMPCKLNKANDQNELWFGSTIGTWRDCLEALLAGDFLTPVAIGLTFYDVLRLKIWPDRAELLERSWEERFALVTGATLNENATTTAQTPAECFHLSCPFGYFRPTEDFWLPLLVLNGTSVNTGRRIITTPLTVSYTVSEGALCPTGPALSDCRLFMEAYRFHDLITDATDPDFRRAWIWGIVARLQHAFLGQPPRPPEDVPLSTAGHNSARFPLISPVGAIRNRTNQITDRIVDGGYFENYGAVSALELARAMRAINSNLEPFVIIISNDPEVANDLERVLPAERRSDLHKVSGLVHLDALDVDFATELTGPISTFANTRTARGTLAVEQLRAEMGTWGMRGAYPHVAHIRIAPQFESRDTVRPVSMSWWLSKPIQSHLHQQIECGYNRSQMDAILQAFSIDRKATRRGKPCVQDDEQAAVNRVSP